jgi:hypothetical protein
MLFRTFSKISEVFGTASRTPAAIYLTKRHSVQGRTPKSNPRSAIKMETPMSRKSNLVRASLAVCALSLVLSSNSSAAALNVNVHVPVVQAPVMSKALPTDVGNPKHFTSPTGHPSSGNNGRDHEGGGESAFKDARRWGQKSRGGGQPGEPWNR